MPLASLFGWRTLLPDRTAEMAERVAGRSRMAVWQRVKDGLSEFRPLEARGYIRARALPVIKEETERLIEQEGAKVVRLRDSIVATATESLIRSIISQMESSSAGTGLRRAA